MSWLSDLKTGRRLGVAFGLTIAVFVAAIATTLILSSSAVSSWERTASWDRATEGAAEQISGTQDQMRAQSMAVAAMDRAFASDFEAAVARSEAGAAAVGALGDPAIADLAARVREADLAHDAVVTGELLPAVVAGDRAAAVAGLGAADEKARAVLESLVSIQTRVTELRGRDVATAVSTARQARTVGIVASGIGAPPRSRSPT